jgi:hypothetical protein
VVKANKIGQSDEQPSFPMKEMMLGFMPVAFFILQRSGSNLYFDKA